MIHVMGDIETWAKDSHIPLILSLGAVKFDGEEIVERFEIGIDPVDAQRHGLEIEADTVLWWMKDEQAEARKRLEMLPKIDLFSALDGFALWVKQTPLDQFGDFWGNGAVFDNAKLQQIYRKVGVEWPFSYRQDACYRTLKNRCPDVEFVRAGTLHSAVDDAESQARHLQAICKARGLAL